MIKSYLEFHDGAVRFAGTNLKAEYVARMHVEGGDTIDDVMAHYDLTRAEVHAALTYFHENRDALDAENERLLQEGLKRGDILHADFMARIEARQALLHNTDFRL